MWRSAPYSRETSPLLAAVLGVGFTIVTALHVTSAVVERRKDTARGLAADGYIAVCTVERIPEKRACVVSCGGERVAVFRYDGKISAISNVCQHQNGPLGEGKFIDRCVTCPWHGYQYRPDSGASPPPFTRKGSNIPHACGGEPGVRTSLAAASGHASRTFGDSRCATSLNFTLAICRCLAA